MCTAVLNTATAESCRPVHRKELCSARHVTAAAMHREREDMHARGAFPHTIGRQDSARDDVVFSGCLALLSPSSAKALGTC